MINYFVLFLFSRLVYPTIVTLVIMSVEFPGGFGKYMAGGVSMHWHVRVIAINTS